METFNQFLENLGDGLPTNQPNYYNSARQITHGRFNGTLVLGLVQVLQSEFQG